MLLVTAALVLILGVGLYGWASFVSSQHFNLPSQAEMVASVDPCSYLTNADAGTNGRDREGVVPVRKVLGRCNASQIPIPKFEHVEDALGAYALDIVAMQTSLGWSFKNYERGVIASREQASILQEAVLRSIDQTDDAEKLVVATAIASYSAKLRHVTGPKADWTPDARGEPQTSFDPVTGWQQADEERGREVNRGVLEHLRNPRFVTNQLLETVSIAKVAYEVRKNQALESKGIAVGSFYAAVSLFGAFLAVMLTFVFIKIEIDLRDIRDNLQSSRPSVTGA